MGWRDLDPTINFYVVANYHLGGNINFIKNETWTWNLNFLVWLRIDWHNSQLKKDFESTGVKLPNNFTIPVRSIFRYV